MCCVARNTSRKHFYDTKLSEKSKRKDEEKRREEMSMICRHGRILSNACVLASPSTSMQVRWRRVWSDHDRPLIRVGWRGKQTILTIVHKKLWKKKAENQYKTLPSVEYQDRHYFEREADKIDINGSLRFCVGVQKTACRSAIDRQTRRTVDGNDADTA